MTKPLENIATGLKKAHKKTIVPFVDLLLGKTMSKKLMVFFIATWFVMREYISSSDWVQIASIYVGSQGAVDLGCAVVGNYRRRKNSEEEAR